VLLSFVSSCGKYASILSHFNYHILAQEHLDFKAQNMVSEQQKTGLSTRFILLV